MREEKHKPQQDKCVSVHLSQDYVVEKKGL